MPLSVTDKIIGYETLVPGFERTVDGETIVWLDSRPQPTEAEVEAAYVDATLSMARRMRKDYIEKIRDSKLYDGVEYTMPGGATDIVQTRGEKDLVALLSLNGTANNLKDAGVTNPVIEFRSESDVRYFLTPIETINMLTHVNGVLAGIYSLSWDLKDDIDAIVHNPSDDVSVTVAAINAIDWP